MALPNVSWNNIVNVTNKMELEIKRISPDSILPAMEVLFSLAQAELPDKSNEVHVELMLSVLRMSIVKDCDKESELQMLMTFVDNTIWQYRIQEPRILQQKKFKCWWPCASERDLL